MKDLTRWNRAGLTRFRYIDGNAVEYLEFLRQRLVSQFMDPDNEAYKWIQPAEVIPDNEQEMENESILAREERLSLRQQRIIQTYQQDRRDWAWEISRSFARCCHMLTEHADAYANEGFLGTATQWDHVRRLVEMLDYHPAPPASASTWLTLIAKQGMSGIIKKGFQVKNSPPAGSEKVIFETLTDHKVDWQLNVLRPAGWNKNSQPASSDSVPDTPAEKVYSPVANESAIYIQGVGEVWLSELNAYSSSGNFKIKDFLQIDPDNAPALNIGNGRLRELKAKAIAVSCFELDSGWSDISDLRLPEIIAATPEFLSEQTSKNLDQVSALKLKIDLLSVYLDQPFFNLTRLRHLLAPAPSSVISGSVKTSWEAPKKPKVDTGQVALVHDHVNDQAEAASIASIGDQDNAIELLPSPVQTSWLGWPLSDIALQVSPRWHKKCWLNGHNVLRTKEAHGLAADSYVAWKLRNVWFFAKVIEADKRGLRLETSDELPPPGTQLIEAFPIESDVMATTMEAVGLADGSKPTVKDYVFPDAEKPLFTMKSSVPLPELSPPGMTGGLSFGSFLFPTPLLPMDLVKAAVELMLNMGVMVIPSTGEVVFKSMPKPPTVDDLFALLNDNVDWNDDFEEEDIKEELAKMLASPVDQPIVLFQEILDNLKESGPLIAVRKEAKIKGIVDTYSPIYFFDSTPDGIEPDDWLVGAFKDGLRALKVSIVTPNSEDESFSLGFSNLVGSEGELEKIYGGFRAALEPQNAFVSTEVVDNPELPLEDVPDSLKVGQPVLLTAEGKAEPAIIEGINGDVVTLNPPPSDFTKGELVINANVVLAGHGETKPQKILGSGDAAKSNQSFVLEVEQLSFVTDATKSAGVAAAIDVIVAERIWQQVDSLKDSVADDHHYIVRMTEEGYIKIQFGDGKYGRRLPTGKNNVRVVYRVGSGLGGNVSAGNLEKALSPHPVVAAIIQTSDAAGGGDMEDIRSLKENAPPSILTFKRAVSLSDFSHLAASQSSIWQAKAYIETAHGSRAENIGVIIVAADGVKSDDIRRDLASYLQQHAVPTVRVHVYDFKQQLFNLGITARVDINAFNPGDIKSNIEAAVESHFQLKNRRLGANLYLSEVFKVVEGVKGVENSVCIINNDETIKVLRAEGRERAVFLDRALGSVLEISIEAYQP